MRTLSPREEALLRLIQAENDLPMEDSTLICDNAGQAVLSELVARGLVTVRIEEHVVAGLRCELDVARPTDLGRLALRVATTIEIRSRAR